MRRQILIYDGSNKIDNKYFPKNVYVKMYETAQLTMFNVFQIRKQKSTLTLEMYCGLHFPFRRAHYHS
jgi:hypothetical protein